MNDYYQRLEDQLAQLTKKGAHLENPASRPRRASTVLVSAVSVSVAVAVAAVILLSVRPHAAAPVSTVGHRGIGHGPPTLQHRRGPAPGEILYPLGAVATLRQLMANFEVLRRPQTALDRSWRPQCGCGPAARQLNDLTRVAATLPGGYRVFFDVEQFIYGGQLNMAAGSYVLNLDIVNHKGNSASEAFGPNTGYAISPLSWLRPFELRTHPQGGKTVSSVFASVVPDGVSTVSWTFGCQRGHRSVAGRYCAGVRTRTFTVPVANNVAARVLSGIGRCFSCIFAQRVIWRAADGRIVAAFPSGWGNLPAPPFITGDRGNRTLGVLAPDAVADARLREPSAAAIQTITALLGPPADQNIPTGGCGIDHETVWTSPSVADPLTIFQRNGLLVGYQYGAPVSEIGLQRGPGAILTTPQGLTLANTIRTAKRLYGTGLKTSAHRGVGSWHLQTIGGTFYGQVMPITYPLRTVTDRNPIATAQAGDTGCPPHGNQ